MSELSSNSPLLKWCKLKAKYLNQVYGGDPNSISTDGFELLGTFQGQPLKEVYSEVVKIIDETPYDQLIFKPIKDLREIKQIFSTKIPTKAFYLFMNTWPSVVSTDVPTVDPMIRLLVKMCLSSALPEKFLAWIYSVLTLRHWSAESKKPNLLAASLCKPKNNGLEVWTLLTNDRHVAILEECGNNFRVISNEVAFSAKSVAGEIHIYNEQEKVISIFTPVDPNTFDLWVDLLSDSSSVKKPTFMEFLTTADYKQLPLDVAVATSEYFSLSNMDYVRSILIPDAIPYDQLESTFEDLYTIARYYQKVTILNHAVLTAIFEQPDASLEQLTGPKSLLHPLYRYFVRAYGTPYFQNFIKKLITYINTRSTDDSLASLPPEEVEKVLMTCIKYVLASIQFYPPEIQHITSMIYSYANTKFNSKVATFSILADFFVRFVLCESLRHPEAFDSEAKGSNSLNYIADLLEVSLLLKETLAETGFSFPTMDKRIERYFSQITDFILETRVLFFVKNDKVYRCAPVYRAPSSDELVSHSQRLTKTVAQNCSGLSRIFRYMREDLLFATSSLGWALSEIVLKYCKSESEDERPLSEKEKDRLIKQPYTSLLKGKMCVGPDESQIPMEGGVIPTKTYKRVKKTQKSIVSGTEAPQDRVVEEHIVSEVMNEDGSKKTVIRKTVHRKVHEDK